jgi:hypothetical protein
MFGPLTQHLELVPVSMTPGPEVSLLHYAVTA